MSSDYQATLLDYYVKQSVAHGALLFSAVVATFYFFNLLSGSSLSCWHALLVALFGGFLVGSCIFILGRLIVYGMLSQYTLNTNPANISSLYHYKQQVINKIRDDRRHAFRFVFAIYASSSNILWARFVVSYVVGFFGSLVFLTVLGLI